MRWHPKREKILNKKKWNKVWEVINLFELQNKFLATQLDGREFLCVVARKEMCSRWEKGKLQIKEEISLLRIAFLYWDNPSVTFLLILLFHNVEYRKFCIRPFYKYLYPSEKSNSCGVKSVVLKRMAYMCTIVLKMDTFLLTAFFPFHTHFIHLEILCWKQQRELLF